MQTLDAEMLNETVRRLVETLSPEEIFLYGSHAYGRPHADSDVDLLVVVRESTAPVRQQAVAAYRALRGLAMPAEIKVVPRDEFERRVHYVDSIERVVREKGRRLYASTG